MRPAYVIRRTPLYLVRRLSIRVRRDEGVTPISSPGEEWPYFVAAAAGSKARAVRSTSKGTETSLGCPFACTAAAPSSSGSCSCLSGRSLVGRGRTLAVTKRDERPVNLEHSLLDHAPQRRPES